MPLDRAGADEQLRGNLGVGASFPRQPDDVLLLRGELAVGADLAFADLLAGGEQLTARPLGEGLGPDRGEQVIGGTELVPGVEPPVLATEPLTKKQVGSGQLRPKLGAAEPLDRLGVAVLRLPAFADQCSRARLQAFGPV